MTREIKFRAWDKEYGKMYYDVGIGNTKSLDDVLLRDLSYMQYTRLKDKNGKEIYEGDVVLVREKKQEVKFMTVFGGYWPFTQGDGCGCCTEDSTRPEYAEIIGNIYENKELIK